MTSRPPRPRPPRRGPTTRRKSEPPEEGRPDRRAADPGHRLQGREAALPLHQRARQDSPTPTLRRLRPSPAPAPGGHQAGPLSRPAALHQGLQGLSGRRASLGAAAVLAGFLLLAPPIYLLGPLTLLLLPAKPKTTRELFWLAVAAAGTSATLAGSVTTGYLLIRISGIALALVFVALSLRSLIPVFPRDPVSVLASYHDVVIYAVRLDVYSLIHL